MAVLSPIGEAGPEKLEIDLIPREDTTAKRFRAESFSGAEKQFSLYPKLWTVTGSAE
jgi:hypothetical protein